MFRKAIKSLSILGAASAMFAAVPAHAAIYIIYWGPDNTIIGSEMYSDYGEYCGLYGETSGIYTVVEIGYTGTGCP